MEQSWVKTIFKFASECKGKITLSVVVASLGVFFGIVPYWSTYKLLLLFINKEATFTLVIYYGVIGIVAYMFRYLCHYSSTILSHISAYAILRNIRERLAHKLLVISMGAANQKTVGEYKSVLVDRVEALEIPLAHIIPECIASLCLSIGIATFMLSISWKMTLAMLVTLPFALLAYKNLMENFNELYQAQMESNKYMNSTIVEYIAGIEVIKTFNQDRKSYEKYKEAVTAYRDYTLNWFRSTWGSMNFVASVLPSTFLGTLPVGMILYAKGSLSPADFCICLMLSLGIVTPLTQFTHHINQFKIIEYAVKDVNEILALPELMTTNQRVDIQSENIEFDNISFSYTGHEENNVLENISLDIPEGTFTAIVGESGSGKSTLIKLLSRYWDVTHGQIKIDACNIKDIPLSQLNELIAYVSQDNFLFNESIIENIRVGNPAASDDEIIKVSKLCACHDFIMEFEDGYNSQVGSLGSKLSGGQKQRIAIARMMLKDAPIVLLDEATAFVDPDNEAKVQEAIKILTKNKTLVVVAHRLSTIKDADNIVVLKDKHILAQGKHDELLENCPAYKDMWLAHIGAKAKSTVSNLGSESDV